LKGREEEMPVEMKISLFCRCCGQELEVTPYYRYGNDLTTLNVTPCKKGCSEADMIKRLEESQKEECRKAKLPITPVFGDHLRSFR
jgi:hypothetical protein